MNVQRVLLVASAAMLLATASAACSAASVPLEPRLMLTPQQRARLQAIADEGADALRRFLWRTRMIYGWTWQDLVAGE